ncbi:hypothetical protein [Christiangramia sp. OXR-203]|jgi:hypothetical protein|uniref:hypothetical protein n=1 Tax=Christiangramia sp. OXR-203 TaxID=3100176 RepID=UPI002AC8F746|nr:hypothetical protein [Christiangramia sp. OXR-203]WPY99721.1 hypothetical protein T8I65_05795 [Christiangramia sp. OXR-203]
MKVIFFSPNILRDAHKQIFQLDRLVKEGFDVVMLDATRFYGNKSTATEEIILNNKIECSTEEDFYNFKQSLGKDPVLYVAFDQYMNFAAPILRILVRKQDKVLSYHTKRFSTAQFPTNKLRIIFDKVVKKADKMLPLHLFAPIYRWKYKIFIPDYYLCSTNYVIPTKAYLTIKKDNRIVVHADDINNIIKEKSSTFSEGLKIGVFLDQVLPFQDRLHPKITPPIPHEYIELYYKNLEKTLWKLKEELHLDKVIIALHPDAVKLEQELADKFKGFDTRIGATNELIKNAEIVFGHSSTALGFAVFYRKPVILFKDEFLMKDFDLIQKFTSFFENALGFKQIYMDKTFKLPEKPFQIDEAKYDDYIHKFLKDNTIQENSYYYAINKIKSDLNT